MSHFEIPVSNFMSSPVVTVGPDDSLDVVQRLTRERGISSLAVVDEAGALSGVITRTDLLRVGRRQAGTRSEASLLALPDKPVSELMSTDVVTLAPDEHVTSAAKRMVAERLHRVLIVDGGKPVGVLSTRDLMTAIRDKRLNSPISDCMSSPVFTVRAEEPISLATERLEKAKVSGLVVVEDEWPVGIFTQAEALSSSDLKRSTPVDEAMSTALLCLDETTKLHRAAAQAAAMHVRRVIATTGQQLSGILTGLDFAKAASR